MSYTSTSSPAGRGRAAERLLSSAATLFYRDGVRAVGVDAVAEEAGVTKVTLYKHFGSKDQLVTAYLRERQRRWQETVDEIHARHPEPRARVVAIFDAYADWLSAGDFRGCAFVNAMAELADRQHPARAVVAEHKRELLGYLHSQTEAGGSRDASQLAQQLLALLEGAAVLATLNEELTPVREARAAADRLLAMSLDSR